MQIKERLKYKIKESLPGKLEWRTAKGFNIAKATGG
jgi:hypothetical protein